jgi:two-component system chemotaxis response regulator CheB
VRSEPPRGAPGPAEAAARTRVLVVDDSALVRQVTRTLLEEQGLDADVAADPFIALEKIGRVRPDVIVLDLEMPRMDGLTFLRKLMREDPIPVVVCSALTGPGTDAALRALEEGAVEIVSKPRLGVKGFLEESSARLVDGVRAAARARPRTRSAASRLVPPKLTADAVLPARRLRPRAGDRVVAIGASTGGTEALREILEALPSDSPGLVIVQHMPEAFTAAFARRLGMTSRLEVREAADGDRVREGLALVAPGDRHVLLENAGASYRVNVLDGPPVSRHRPSVNVLFRSAAQVAGRNAVGVLLTGMGDDGADGLLELRSAGAHTVAQDESTSVVFGMPGAAIARGAALDVLPLPRIPAAILAASRRETGEVFA